MQKQVILEEVYPVLRLVDPHGLHPSRRARIIVDMSDELFARYERALDEWRVVHNAVCDLAPDRLDAYRDAM